MEEENKTPVLLELLFGEEAETARRGASARLVHWAAAFDEWLGERRERSPSTVRGAVLAWRRLLRQCGKMPWELQAGDIEGHSSWMLAEGYKTNTIYQAQALIQDFLRWYSERKATPSERRAGNGGAARAKRLKVRIYETAQMLGREEAERLLRVMGRDETPVGRRDFAFTLTRLRTGVQLGQLQRLKWGQLEGTPAEGGARVRWRAWEEGRGFPEEAWEAILRALEAAGRLREMRPEDYVFAALIVTYLQEAGGEPEHWQRDRQVTSDVLLENVKKYGPAAGIGRERLTMRGLRNTAIRLRLDEGASLEEMHIFMDSRDDLYATKFRLGKLPELPEESGQPARAEGVTALPNRMGKPFTPGEGVKHGFYAHFQPPEAVAAVLRENIQGIEEQIVGLRRLGRGLLERQAQTTDGQEAAQLGDSYSKAAYRLAEMIQAEKRMAERGKPDRQAEQILEQIDRAAVHLGFGLVSEGIRAEALGREPILATCDRRLVEEMASLRYVLRNIFELAAAAQDGREYMRMVEIYGSGGMRLLSMLKGETASSERLLAHLNEMIDEAIQEAARRLGVRL